jgi:hypothetical protein
MFCTASTYLGDLNSFHDLRRNLLGMFDLLNHDCRCGRHAGRAVMGERERALKL